MAATQPILAGTTLPHPQTFRERVGFRGTSTEMADGSQTTDLVESGIKKVFTLVWNLNVTASTKADIITAFTAIKDTSGSFTSPDSTVYTVTREGDAEIDFEYELVGGGAFRFSGSLSLREV